MNTTATRPRSRLLPASGFTWLALALMALAVIDYLIPVPPTEGHWLNRWALAAVGVLGSLGGLSALFAIAFRRERTVIGLAAGAVGVLWIFVTAAEFASAA